MKPILAEIRFLITLVGLNLAAAMEYRASFISQIVGMMINNAIMLVFWYFFFDRFGAIRGYDFEEIFLLFGMVAFAYGLVLIFGGNVYHHLAVLVARGRLDYYLVFPRNLLLHVVFSRMQISAIGDFSFGLLVAVLVIGWRPLDLIALLAAGLLGGLVILAYGVIAGSLSFLWGSAENASAQMFGALVTFALYPHTLFTGLTRTLLLTLIPSIFIGALPAQLVTTRDPALLLALLAAAGVSWLLAIAAFYGGLRRYESGSAINVNV